MSDLDFNGKESPHQIQLGLKGAQKMRKIFLAIIALAILFLALAPFATPATAETQTLICPDGRQIVVPTNGQVFEANVNGAHNAAYDVVYDPYQSGRNDIPAKGWWYQPCLPGPNRMAHEVAVTLQAGEYAYLGPECFAWLNWDGNHPFDKGQLLVSRQNIEHLNVSATSGHEPESWVFVKCNESAASGFSFALREPSTVATLSPTATYVATLASPIPPANTLIPTPIVCKVPEPPAGKVEWDPSTCKWNVLEAPTAIPPAETTEPMRSSTPEYSPTSRPERGTTGAPIDWTPWIWAFLLLCCCGGPYTLALAAIAAWSLRPRPAPAAQPAAPSNIATTVANGAAHALGFGGVANILTSVGNWFKKTAPAAKESTGNFFSWIWEGLVWTIKIIGRIIKFVLWDWWIWLAKKSWSGVNWFTGCAFWLCWWILMVMTTIGAIVASIFAFPLGLLTWLVPIVLSLIGLIVRLITHHPRSAAQPAPAPAPTPTPAPAP